MCQVKYYFELWSLYSHEETVRSTSKYLGLQSNGIGHRVNFVNVHCHVLEKLQLPTEVESIGVVRNVGTYVLNCTAPHLRRLFMVNTVRAPKLCVRLHNFEL